MNRMMRMAGIIALAALGAAACSNVPPGHEGVRVSKTGGGVQEQEVGEGWHFIPPTEDLIVYSLREQNFRFEADRRVGGCNAGGGTGNPRAFCIQDREGMTVGVDLGLRFNVEPGASDDLVRRYGSDLDDIIYGPIRNNLLNVLTNNASRLTAAEIYGQNRSQFLAQVQEDFRASIADLPLQGVQVYWLSEIALPPGVRQRIDEQNEAEQIAQRRRNEIATAEAEAEIRIQQARGESEARLLVATAEAEAIRVIGEAIQANPSYLRQQEIERWDGVLPVYYGSGGPVPIVSVDRTGSN